MFGDEMKKAIEDRLRLPASVLKDHLAGMLEETRQYGIEKLLLEVPGFMAGLLRKMREADPARLLSEVPGAAERLADILWEGVASRAGRSEAVKTVLAGMDRDFHGNIEASDSPFQCHFVLEGGNIRGGAGLLHFREEDFRFMGPTGLLMDLLLGELPMGFGNLRLQTAGHPGWLKRVAPVMGEIARLLKGA